MLLAVALVLPATGQYVTFTVGAKRKSVANFDPDRMYWTCADTGEDVWTEVGGLSARIIAGGAFSSTSTMHMEGIGRQLTVQLNGRFTSRRDAEGTVVYDLAGCGRQVFGWMAFGPERKKKGGGGGGGGGGGDDICVPVQISTFPYWVCT